MLQLLKSFVNRLAAGTKAPPRPRTARPRLEALEERWCPTTYDWQGGVGATWNNKNNWFNETTQATATAVPDSTIDVKFTSTKSNNGCRIDDSFNAQCKSLTEMNGTLCLLSLGSSSSLTMGSGAGVWSGDGAIDVLSGDTAWIELSGGSFHYEPGGASPLGYNDAAMAGGLSTYISGGGSFRFDMANASKMNTDLYVAKTHGGTLSTGSAETDSGFTVGGTINLYSTLSVKNASTLTLTAGNTMNVNSGGVLSISTNCGVTLDSNSNCFVNSGGLVQMGIGSTITAKNVLVSGGTLVVGNSGTNEDYGNAYIVGNLSFTESGMTPSTFIVDVNEATSGGCGCLSVNGNITSDGTTNLTNYNNNALGTDDKDYKILTATGAGHTISTTGTDFFGSHTRHGQNGGSATPLVMGTTPWTESMTSTSYWFTDD
jgi:hypothetical protein